MQPSRWFRMLRSLAVVLVLVVGFATATLTQRAILIPGAYLEVDTPQDGISVTLPYLMTGLAAAYEELPPQAHCGVQALVIHIEDSAGSDVAELWPTVNQLDDRGFVFGPPYHRCGWSISLPNSW